MVSKSSRYSRPQVQEIVRRPAEPGRFLQVVAGARQVGKTTAMQQAVERSGMPTRQVRRGRTLAAIEVKSGRRPSVLPGMEAFSRRFPVTRKRPVGADGIALQAFLERPVAHWLR